MADLSVPPRLQSDYHIDTRSAISSKPQDMTSHPNIARWSSTSPHPLVCVPARGPMCPGQGPHRNTAGSRQSRQETAVHSPMPATLARVLRAECSLAQLTVMGSRVWCSSACPYAWRAP